MNSESAPDWSIKPESICPIEGRYNSVHWPSFRRTQSARVSALGLSISTSYPMKDGILGGEQCSVLELVDKRKEFGLEEGSWEEYGFQPDVATPDYSGPLGLGLDYCWTIDPRAGGI